MGCLGIRERKSLARSDPSQIGIIEDHENVKHLLTTAQHHAEDMYRSRMKERMGCSGNYFPSNATPSPPLGAIRNYNEVRANIKTGQPKLQNTHIENADTIHEINSENLVGYIY